MASPPNSCRADGAASGRPDPAYSLLTDRNRLIVQRRWPWSFDGRRLQGAVPPLPALWSSPKAAERWLEKEPIDAHRDITRVWGLLHEYRPPGQTSWSEALVGTRGRSGEGAGGGDGDERRGHTGEGLSRLGDLRAPPSYPKATFGSAHQRQQWWLPALGTRGLQRPLSDPSTDLQVRCHGSERDGRDVPKCDLV
jgi:hypothetical protein